MSDEAPKQPGFFRRNWKYSLLALLLVPYFSWEAMKERKARERDETAFVIDDQFPDLKLIVESRNAPGEVQYGNGKRIPLDSYGLAMLSWDDFQKQIDRFGEVGKSLKEPDFPVVVFFNSSGFDATGDPMVVRRVSDGEVVMELKTRPSMLRLVVPSRDGTFRLFAWNSKSAITVNEEEWYKKYVGVEPPKPLPSREELDKMTDEQLKAIGIQRVTTPNKPNTPSATQEKSGINGKILKVGGIPAVQPLSLPVHVFAGKDVKPFQKLTPGGLKPLKSMTSDKDGVFTFSLPPGVYTVVVEYQGKLTGNAVKPGVWPSVRVGDGWTKYEFRVPQ